MTDATVIEGSGNPRHWGMLGTVLWGAGIATAFAGLQLVVILAYVTHGKPDLAGDELRMLVEANKYNGVMLSLATLLTTVLCVPLVLGIAKLKRGSRLAAYLAFNPVPLGTLGKWLGVTALFLLASDLLAVVLGKPVVPEFMRAAYSTAEPVWLLWLAFVVAAPLFEEVFFRGFLFKGLEGSLKPTGAIVATSVLWAAIHTQYDMFGIGFIFVTGLLLGAARSRTQSMWPPLAMHVLTNAVACIEAGLLVSHVAT